MLITMALVALVSLVAFSAMGIRSVASLNTAYSTALDFALDNDSAGAELPFLGGGRNQGGRIPQRGSVIPAYCVTVSSAGYVYSENGFTAQMDNEVLTEAITTVLSSYSGNTIEGRISQYNLLFKAVPNSFGCRIAFVDSSSYYQSLISAIVPLAVAWIVLMLALLAVTIFLSRYATRPVAAAWEQQQRFIADASHELKTPLTVILADAAILAKNPEKTVAEQQTWIDGISSEAERMRRLTEDMLTLAQADAGEGMAPQFSNTDLSQIVERSILQFEAAAFERGLLIEESIQEGIHVMGDHDRLESLVQTLLENACKYGAGSNEPIRVDLARSHNSAVLSITNSGSEISAEDLPHVFERFYKSDKSRARDGESASFGLGLSIAKSTAEMHKGDITASSGKGKTTFTVTIPSVR